MVMKYTISYPTCLLKTKYMNQMVYKQGQYVQVQWDRKGGQKWLDNRSIGEYRHMGDRKCISICWLLSRILLGNGGWMQLQLYNRQKLLGNKQRLQGENRLNLYYNKSSCIYNNFIRISINNHQTNNNNNKYNNNYHLKN